MRRCGSIVTAAVCGLVLVAACGPGTTAAHPADGLESVRIGPYTQVFGSAPSADPVRALAVQGFRKGMILWDRSEFALRLVAPVRDYVTGQALSALIAGMRFGRERDVVPAGTDRLFMTRVASAAGSRAVITTCDDGSRFREQNRRTGRVNPALTAEPQQQYISETWRMGLLHGHWAITGLTLASLPSQSAERCQPGLAASGVPRPPAMPVLLRAVVAAMRGASSVHVSGAVKQGGKTLGVDLGMTRSGGVSGQVAEGGGDVTVLATGGRTYLRLDAAILRLDHAPSGTCRLLCGKYVQTTTTQSPGLASLSMSGLIASVTRPITGTPARKVSFGGTMVLHGEPVWVLQDKQQSTALVAARGRPYLLQIAAPQPGEGMMSFTQWNAVQIPGPPPANQVVHLSQLGGGQAA